MLNGLFMSAVLSTFPRPTLLGLIPLAIFELVTAPSINFVVEIVLLLIMGKSAVPVKSPASLIFPLVFASASTIDALLTFKTPKLAMEASTYVFTAFELGYLVSKLPSAFKSKVLFIVFSFKFIRLLKEAVSLANLLFSIKLVSLLFNFASNKLFNCCCLT